MEEIEQKLREKLGDPEGRFPSTYTFPDFVKKYNMPFEYRKKDKQGNFQKKFDTMMVAIAYNPWTGEKLI
jgi:hypothetical protein